MLWTRALTTCLAAAVPLADDSCEPGSSILHWLQQLGGTVDGVELRSGGVAGRGVFATRDLPEGHTIVQAPPQALVTISLAAETSLGAKLLQAAKEGSLPDFRLEGLLLTTWLLERDTDPFWQPFFASLPDEFDSPLNASDCAEGLDLAEYLEEMRLLLRMEHEYLQTLAPLPWSRYLWARLASFSRTFTVPRMAVRSHALAMHQQSGHILPEVPVLPGMSGKESFVLLPGLDLINHAHPHNVSCSWNYVDKGVLARTTKAVAAGSEIFVSYGEKANDVFLTHYGFVTPNNRKDSVSLALHSSKANTTLNIQGDMPAQRQDFEAILTFARDAHQGESKEVELAALGWLKTELSTHRARLQPRADCSPAFVLYRSGLVELVDTWLRFVSNALELLSGSPLDKSHSGASSLQLHSRLYFGLWLTSRGRDLVDEATFMEARPWGRVRYFDISDV